MAKEKLNLEELKEKGLVHLANLLEAEKKDDEDLDIELDDEEKEEDEKEVKESSAFDAAVEGLSLEESQVQQMKDVFDAAVSERVKALVEAQLAGLEEKITTQLNEQQEANDKHIANYLDFVVEGWVKDNELEITKQVKVDLAESFLGQLRSLFESHSLILESDEKLDQIKEATEAANKAKEELAEAVDMLAEAKQEVFAFQVKDAIRELSEGMTDIQRERFNELVGEMEVDMKEGLETVVERLTNMKDSFITESKKEEVSSEVVIEEEIQEAEVKEEIEEQPKVDEKMASYLSGLKRTSSTRYR